MTPNPASTDDASDRSLVEVAAEASALAYSPYSGLRVGAALRSADGQVFAGCNVENASYGLTVCAERTALFTAIAAGCREFETLVVYTDREGPLMPCGACRQVLFEFAPRLRVLVAGSGAEPRAFALEELLPGGVAPSDVAPSEEAPEDSRG